MCWNYLLLKGNGIAYMLSYMVWLWYEMHAVLFCVVIWWETWLVLLMKYMIIWWLIMYVGVHILWLFVDSHSKWGITIVCQCMLFMVRRWVVNIIIFLALILYGHASLFRVVERGMFASSERGLVACPQDQKGGLELKRGTR